MDTAKKLESCVPDILEFEFWKNSNDHVTLPLWLAGKESTSTAGNLGWEDPLEKGKATHSSILAWRIIPWTV